MSTVTNEIKMTKDARDQLMELVDEYSDQIPDGMYLRMCNMLGKATIIDSNPIRSYKFTPSEYIEFIRSSVSSTNQPTPSEHIFDGIEYT